MSYEQTIDTDDNWFIGEDRTFHLRVYVAGTSLEDAENDTGTREAVNLWIVESALMKSQHGTEPAIISKQAVSQGTGLLEVLVLHGNTDTLAPGEYFQTWKRIDGNNQGVLSFGKAVLRRGAII